MTFKPLSTFVLVEATEEKEKTEGGLYVPLSAREKDGTAVVLAVGDGEYQNGTLVPMKVKVGDKVLYDKFAGVKLKVDGKDALLLRQNDLYGKWE